MLQLVQEKIAQALKRSDRTDPVKILPISKKQTIQDIKAFYAKGFDSFGENYLSEALPKIEALPHAQWHYVGPLQTNKIKEIVQKFSVVQSVGRKKEIELLERYAAEMDRMLPVYLQWDPGVEESKHGALASDIPVLALEIEKCKHLALSGLMMMAPNIPERRRYFQQAKAIFDVLKSQYPRCTTLSMGMSDDYEVAIEEGATMVRLGTAIFGKR